MTTTTTTTAPALDEYLLTHAFDGISWSPENWINNTRREYAARLAEFDEKTAELENAAALRLQFAQGLTARYNAWLSAMSRCMSWAIAGPARFPVRKAEAANKRERDAREKLDNWYSGQMARLDRSKAAADGKGPIMADDPQAPEKLRARIEFLEALHALEISYNKARRKGKDQAAEWLKENLPDQSEPIKKEFQKRFAFYQAGAEGGFPSYHFQLENANVKRLKGRRADIERTREACAAAADHLTADGVRIERDGAANRLRIYYPDKPDAETRTRLKRAGFRWAPSVGAWQNYINRQAENFVTSEFA